MRVLSVIFMFTVACAKHEKYTGWKSYIVGPSSVDQLKSLVSITERYELDFWIHPTMQREGIVIVKPNFQQDFVKALKNLGVGYRTHIDDVKTQFDYEESIIQQRRKATRARNARELPFDNYQNIETINAHVADIAKRYPDKVKLVIPANSFEGRPIHYLKISTTNFEDQSKPVIFIDGCIHAREWVAPPTVLWAIEKLVVNVTEPDLLEKFDWILLPVVNPDGYEFSITKEPDWRMTRSTDQHENSSRCPGVDGNRNYDFYWNQAGTSKDPCIFDSYGGSHPFSEVETRVVRDILKENLNRLALYITVHSFGSFILYPWGHDGSLSNNSKALHLVGKTMAQAIDSHSLPDFDDYTVGNSAVVVGYKASGASDDYAHSIGVPLTYTLELPGHEDGFHLKPKYIEQVCRETWEGFVVGARKAGDLFVGNFRV